VVIKSQYFILTSTLQDKSHPIEEDEPTTVKKWIAFKAAKALIIHAKEKIGIKRLLK